MPETRPNLEVSRTHRDLVMLLLDRSGSMNSPHVEEVNGRKVTTTRINALSDAVSTFLTDAEEGLRGTRVASTAEIAIGGFHGLQVSWEERLGNRGAQRFTPLAEIVNSPQMTVVANDATPLVTAIKEGVSAMLARMKQIEDHPALSLKRRPNIFLLSDGKPEPEDQDVDGAARLLHKHVFSKGQRPDFFFYAIGIHAADDAIMRRIAGDSYIPIRDTPLAEIMEIVTRTTENGGYAALRKEYERRYPGMRRVGDDD